jgi:hypothetical protein
MFCFKKWKIKLPVRAVEPLQQPRM